MSNPNEIILKLLIEGNQAFAVMDNGERKLLNFEKNATKAGKNITDNFKKMAAALGLALSIDQVIRVGKFAIENFAEQERAQTKLRTALGFTSKALHEQANQLQDYTGIADDQVLAAQSLIAAYTKEEDWIKRITVAALDFAVAKDVELKSATDLLVKSIFSETNAMSRYGITIDGAKGSLERMESAVMNITRLYGGQAHAAILDYTGKVERLKNQIGDAAEELGGVLVEAIYGAEAAFKAFDFNPVIFLKNLMVNAAAAAKQIAESLPWEYTREASLKAMEEIEGKTKTFIKSRLDETQKQLDAMLKLEVFTKENQNNIEQLRAKISVYKSALEEANKEKKEAAGLIKYDKEYLEELGRITAALNNVNISERERNELLKKRAEIHKTLRSTDPYPKSYIDKAQSGGEDYVLPNEVTFNDGWMESVRRQGAAAREAEHQREMERADELKGKYEDIAGALSGAFTDMAVNGAKVEDVLRRQLAILVEMALKAFFIKIFLGFGSVFTGGIDAIQGGTMSLPGVRGGIGPMIQPLPGFQKIGAIGGGMDTTAAAMEKLAKKIDAWPDRVSFTFENGKFVGGMDKLRAREADLSF
jgi:hypothetical protein